MMQFFGLITVLMSLEINPTPAFSPGWYAINYFSRIVLWNDFVIHYLKCPKSWSLWWWIRGCPPHVQNCSYIQFFLFFYSLSDIKPTLKYIERRSLRAKMLCIHAYSVRCQNLYLSDAREFWTSEKNSNIILLKLNAPGCWYFWEDRWC